MSAPFLQFDKAIIGATAAVATLIMGSCASTGWSASRQVDASRPELNDRYRPDDRSPVGAAMAGDAGRPSFAVEHFGRLGGATPLPPAVAVEAD